MSSDSLRIYSALTVENGFASQAVSRCIQNKFYARFDIYRRYTVKECTRVTPMGNLRPVRLTG